MDEIETGQDLTDEQMDTLVAESERSPNRTIPDREEPAQETPIQAPAQKTQEELLEFNHNGKNVKATRDQVLKWAQQGYDYPQKMSEFNQSRSQWEQQKAQWEQQYSPYRQVDEWAKQNPDAWTKIQESLKNKDQVVNPQTGQPDPYNQKFQSIESELKSIKEFVGQSVAEKNLQKREQEDLRLKEEIKSIRDTYKDLDFDKTDDEGKSLEYRVLEYAKNNKIQQFKTAFRDFYHDQLVTRAETLAKQQVSKDVQKRTKLGVLGESPTPRRGISEAQDIKNKSYESLMAEALDELARGA